MQSINTSSQSSYTPSTATSVFEHEDLQNVLCSYLSEWQKTCLLSTNKTLEPSRWTKMFSFGKDKVKVAAFKELVYAVNDLQAAKKECYDKAVLDLNTLCNNAHLKLNSDLIYTMVSYHAKWDFMTTNLFKDIITSQFTIPFGCNSNVIRKNEEFKWISTARIELQALSWFSSSAWEAEQMLRNSENYHATSKNLENTTSQISLEYPMVKQDKNRGNVISDKVLVDMINRYEIKIALSA